MWFRVMLYILSHTTSVKDALRLHTFSRRNSSAEGVASEGEAFGELHHIEAH